MQSFHFSSTFNSITVCWNLRSVCWWDLNKSQENKFFISWWHPDYCRYGTEVVFVFLCFDVAFILSHIIIVYNLIIFFNGKYKQQPLFSNIVQIKKVSEASSETQRTLRKASRLATLPELFPKNCGFTYLNYVQNRLGLGCLFSYMLSLKLKIQYCPGPKGRSSTFRRHLQG